MPFFLPGSTLPKGPREGVLRLLDNTFQFELLAIMLTLNSKVLFAEYLCIANAEDIIFESLFLKGILPQ